MQDESCCQNAVAISVWIMSDDDNSRVLKIVEVVLKHMLKHEAEHARELKTSDECAYQLIRQAGGGDIQHVCGIASEICKMESLQGAGFIVAPSDVNSVLTKACVGDIMVGDHFEDFYGQVTFT